MKTTKEQRNFLRKASEWYSADAKDRFAIQLCDDVEHLEGVFALKQSAWEMAVRQIDTLEAKIAEMAKANEILERRIAEMTWGLAHTCHDKCQRPACVQSRRLAWAEGMLERAKELTERAGAFMDPAEERWLADLEAGPEGER